MRTWQQVISEVELRDDELSAWIAQRWIRPVQRDGDYFFDEVDVARVRLILELRRDLLVDDEAMPVVLSLVDQLYETRRVLAELRSAMRQLSPEIRADIVRRLQRSA